MTAVLGVNGFMGRGHDAGAAIVVDGRLLAAVEEERLIRVKRAYGLPPIHSVVEVLDIAGLQPSDVDIVTYPWIPALMGLTEADMRERVWDWLRRTGVSINNAELRFVGHHVAHAWSGLVFVPGGVTGRRTAVLVVDGSGECTSGACYTYGAELTPIWHLPQSASLGIYYEAASYYLGFAWGEEGKVMGLAAYGRPSDLPVPLLQHDRLDHVPTRARDAAPVRRSHEERREELVRSFLSLYGDDRCFNARADIALAVQQAVADRVLSYVDEVIGSIDLLVLSGGVALNCSINGLIAERCERGGVQFVVPPPAGDSGVALGSAFAVAAEYDPIAPVDDPFLGRAFESDRIARELAAENVSVMELSAHSLAVTLLEQSAVCGWYEGRSEVGPRALGKRSILARPDSGGVRDRINVMKSRESWRPLAPSLTMDEFERSFPEAAPSPHMLIAASAAPQARKRLEGVIHVDNTSRPQVVTFPGPYSNLLKAMGETCGTEAVTCTSFNQGGEPIVNSPLEALQSARAMGLDMLAGDGWYVPL